MSHSVSDIKNIMPMLPYMFSTFCVGYSGGCFQGLCILFQKPFSFRVNHQF